MLCHIRGATVITYNSLHWFNIPINPLKSPQVNQNIFCPGLRACNCQNSFSIMDLLWKIIKGYSHRYCQQ
jgi:hypothetical protein